MSTPEWQARLASPRFVTYAGADIHYQRGAPAEQLITRLHLVGITPAGRVLVCHSIEGWRFLPGGTREPGESVRELAGRELLEEAGAVFRSEPLVFAAHAATSRLPHPYRPHQPHPHAYWAYAVGRVEVTGPPTNPADGEQIVAVDELDPDTAVAELESHDVLHADVLRDAMDLGLID
ncbi:NUDIX hydrolase [Occultella gossypii]|uniref:NUDIX domain-containing protein n=1 Tax=Occultella gossypii TaxID=2800820 RepID=A0ABS7S982_9MICO|nr:NUDIX domain-containing protein [Occultella gossypii]MBZ2196906.1 NUDIX domain-containing protein [Occultella gossypii]